MPRRLPYVIAACQKTAIQLLMSSKIDPALRALAVATRIGFSATASRGTGLSKDVKTASPDVMSGLTNIQWYMYHQRNVAFFAAFSTRTLTKTDLAEVAHHLVDHAPQLADGFRAHGDQSPLATELVEQVTCVDRVGHFEGLSDRWISEPSDINDRSDLPMFRIRVATRSGGADGEGRASFVLVQVSHALVEGADSALLSRSRTTSRERPLALPISKSGSRQTGVKQRSGLAKTFGTLLGGPAAFGHLLGANLINLRPGPYGYASLVGDRAAISKYAKSQGLRQRPLLFALGLIGLFGQDALSAKKRVTTTYSAIDASGDARSGGFMHMRMLFAAFPTAPDLTTLARSIDDILSRQEGRSAGFNDALNAAALGAHRWLYQRVPGFYNSNVFGFMPYDAVLGLLPPHRLDGPLTSHLMEPVYAGAALDGSNACVIVPGRSKISFNFYAQSAQLRFVDQASVALQQLSRPAG